MPPHIAWVDAAGAVVDGMEPVLTAPTLMDPAGVVWLVDPATLAVAPTSACAYQVRFETPDCTGQAWGDARCFSVPRLAVSFPRDGTDARVFADDGVSSDLTWCSGLHPTAGCLPPSRNPSIPGCQADTGYVALSGLISPPSMTGFVAPLHPEMR